MFYIKYIYFRGLFYDLEGEDFSKKFLGTKIRGTWILGLLCFVYVGQTPSIILSPHHSLMAT